MMEGKEFVCHLCVCQLACIGNMEVRNGLREELGTVKSEPKGERRTEC